MADTNIAAGAAVDQPSGPDVTELEKLNSYADEGTAEKHVEEQATQPTEPSAEVAVEEQPASPTSGKAPPKKRGSRKKTTAAAGEKHDREEEQHAGGEETAEGEKKPKRSRTSKTAKAAGGEADAGEGAAAEGEAAAATKKKGPGRPRKSSKKEREEAAAAAAPAESDAPAMEVDVGGAPGEKGAVAEGETIPAPELAKKKRGPGRPKKGDLAGTAATVEHGEGTQEDVPAARTRAKEPGTEMSPQQPAIAEQLEVAPADT